MCADALRVDRSRPSIVVVTIDRPHRRNAGNLDVWQGLRATFAAMRGEPVRLAILTGAGGHFCAGNDIFDYGAIRHDKASQAAWMSAIKDAYAAIRDVPVPVVAVIEGTCSGAGCGLAMCCDFRVAARDARFSIPAARLSILYPPEQTRRLASLIGVSNARRWLYGGHAVDAQAAASDGFVDAVVESDPIAAAVAFATPFLSSAPLSIAGTKRQLNALADGRLDQELATLDGLYHEAENSEDHAEAERAFKQKRPPRFTGR
jgi:enoyl-CoA hydratase/carnithine racemase